MRVNAERYALERYKNVPLAVVPAEEAALGRLGGSRGRAALWEQVKGPLERHGFFSVVGPGFRLHWS